MKISKIYTQKTRHTESTGLFHLSVMGQMQFTSPFCFHFYTPVINTNLHRSAQTSIVKITTLRIHKGSQLMLVNLISKSQLNNSVSNIDFLIQHPNQIHLLTCTELPSEPLQFIHTEVTLAN